MHKKVKKNLISRWIWMLVGISALCLIVNILIFYPGFMSTDSLNQLRQALGTIPRVDLTPISMTYLWQFMIALSGHISSMLLFHLTMLWLSLAALAIFVYKLTYRPLVSLAVLTIGWLPFIINISGVIWKDNSMTFSLLLAVVGMLYIPFVKKTWLKLTLCGVILSLLLYASLVRYNALIAIIPLIFLLIRQSRLVSRLRIQVIGVFLFCIIVAGLMVFINKVGNVQTTNPISAVMIDDVLNISNEQSSSAALQKSIDKMRQCKQDKNVIINNFWVCATDQDRSNIQHLYYSEMKDLWLQTLLHNPLSYGLYRVETFAMFLFPSQSTNYYWQNGILPNEMGYQAKFPKLGHITELYVKNFAFAHFSYLFETWFWLLVNIAVLAYTLNRRIRYFYNYVLALSSSGILYIFSYAPTGATSDYRYMYWSVFSSLVCLVLIISSQRPLSLSSGTKRLFTDS